MKEPTNEHPSPLHAYGWQILIGAILVYLLGLTLGGMVGAFLQLASYVLVVMSILQGIRNIINDREYREQELTDEQKAKKTRATTIMWVVYGIIGVLILGIALARQSDQAPVSYNDSSAIVQPILSYTSEQGTYDYDAALEELHIESDKRRVAAGVPIMQRLSELDYSASLKCQDMYAGKYYAHKNPSTGVSGHELAMQTLDNLPGYYSENLTGANHYMSASDIYDKWYASPDHKEAIINPSYEYTGIAICSAYEDHETVFVVQHFYDQH